MNKKAVAKIGAISAFSIIVFLLVFFVLMPLLSSAELKEEYVLGERVKISLPEEQTKVKIVAPYGSFVQEASLSLIFIPREIGTYSVFIGDKIFSFNVVEEENNDSTQTNLPGNIIEGINRLIHFREIIIKSINNESSQNIQSNISFWSVSGENLSVIGIGDFIVKREEINLENYSGEIGINIPYLSENISLSSNGANIPFRIQPGFLDEISALDNGERFKEIVFTGARENIILEYTLPGPEKFETEVSRNEKQVIVSAPDSFGLENILASTEINEVLQEKDTNLVRVYWVEEDMYINFEAFDSDNNGFLDRVEWIVPHLSNQTFLIILITKAEHLNENRNFLENIYSDVSALDDIFKEIPVEHYVRVSFETNLTSNNDITIYARSNSSARLEVYEKDGSEIIAEFENISGFREYKVFLTNLNQSQDTFDLRVVGGSIEFDYIVDPASTYSVDGDASSVATGVESGLPTGGKNILRLNSNSLLAFWEDAGNDPRCGLSSNNGITWPTGAAENGDYADVAVATNGTSLVYLARETNDNDIMYIIRNTNTCDINSGSFADVSGMTTNYRPDISYDSAHGNYIACSLEIPGDGQDMDFAYASASSALTWNIVNNAGGAGTHQACSLDANSAGNVFIAIDDDGDTAVTVFNSSAGTFASSTSVTAYGSEVNDVHLSIRDNGILITAVNTNDDLVLMNSSNGLSYTNTVLSGTYTEAEGCIDAYGRYHLAVASGGDIDYIQFSNGQFGDFFSIADTANELRYPSVRCSNFPTNNRMDANELELVYTDINDTEVYFANFSVPVNDSIFGNPLVTIISPTATTYTTSSINFNFSLNEPAISCNYSINGGATNNTMATNSTRTGFNATNSSVPDGSYTVRAYCSDYAGNSNFSVSTDFTVSTSLPPGIVINSPSNGSTIADVTPILNITTNGTAANLSYNIGGQNISICSTGCSAGTYYLPVYLNESSFTITVYATTGTGTSSNSTSVIVDLNYNYYDNFSDNSSLLSNQMNNVSWHAGSVNFSSSASNIFSEGFESDLSQWASTNWELSTSRFNSGAQSVQASNGNEQNLDSNPVDTSQSDFINVSFWYNIDQLEDQDIDIYFYNGSGYNLIDQFGDDPPSDDDWYYKEYTTTDSQYMVSNFSVRFDPTLGSGENIWIDDFNISSASFQGNFTAFNANLSSNIIQFTNISWNTAETDQNNNISMQVSTDNGENWYIATNGQGLLGVVPGNGLVYRALFSVNQTNNIISLLDVNISWSDAYNPVPNVVINSPNSGYTTDVSPTLNVTIDGPATSLFYNLNGGANITICTDCSAGDQVLFLYLYEGNYTINVYAADIFNNQNSDFVSISIETNYNHFENYDDNSSLLGGTINNVSWSVGNVSLNADLTFRTALDDNFEDGSYTDNSPTSWTAVSNADGCSWSIVSGIMTESSGCDDGDRNGNAFGGYIYPGNKTWTDVNFTTVLRNSDNDGIGIMFRYINDSNYYRVRFDGTGDYRRLERVQAGTVTVLDSDSLTDGGLAQGDWFELKISAIGSSINVYLNGTPVLSTSDSAFSYGSIALYAWDADTGVFGADFDRVVVEDLGSVYANFTAYKVNVTETITTISNITWDEYETDSGNNNLSVEISANGGGNWQTATKNQGLSLTGAGSSLLYRVLFSSNKTAPIYFSNLNITWSSVAPAVVNVSINYPSNGSTVADVTPTLNVSVDGTANTIWYNVNNGANTTICTSCTGSQSLHMYLYEGDYNIRVYVNNSAGVLRSNSSNFTINLNNNYYDNFSDNSSLLSNQMNDVNWYSGIVNFYSGFSNIFRDGFESGLGNWQATGGWDIVSDRVLVGTSSVRANNGNEGNLDSDDIDTINWNIINVTFWYNEDDMDAGDDIELYFYDGSGYNLVDDFGADQATEDTWYYKTYTTTDSQYFISNFRVRFSGTPEAPSGNQEQVWIDEINITSDNQGNLTAYKINVTNAITSISNITWSSSGDSGTNTLEIELSFDGGSSWLNTTNGQGLSGFTSNNSMFYRALFYTQGYANISLSDINISWSAAPVVNIVYPLATTYSSSVTQLNYSAVSEGGSPSACWWTNDSGATNYTITCGQNITTTSIQGSNTWRVYANDSTGAIGQDSVTFIVDTSAPNITFINQTDEDDLFVNDTHYLEQGQNLTIYANISDDSVDSVWVIVWDSIVGGAQKVKIFFTYVAGFLWKAIIPTDSTWDLLNYNYTIYANDTANLTSNYTGNFSLLKLASSINLNPNPSPGYGNITISGTLNYSNGSVLANYPINLWYQGQLLWLSNLTSIGSYDFYQNKTDTNSADFEKGDFYQTQESGGSIILTSGYASGNYTNILDAGARVDWGSLTWNSAGQSCNTTLSWQEGDQEFFGTSDVYIDATNPNTNYEDTETLFVDTSPTQRALIKFDVFGTGARKIPYNSTISWANISINVEDAGDTVNVYEILENWEESQVTYNNRISGTAWGSTGVANTPSRSATSESSFSPSSTGSYNFSILNAMRLWADQSHSNYGVVLNPGGSNTLEFSSSENPTQENRPILTVAFNSSDCTNIVISVRFSNDKTSWTSWQEISNGSQVNDSDLKYRYLQYRVEMGAVNSTTTPIIQEITANYTAIVTDSSGEYEYNVSSPTSFGSYSFTMNTSLRTMFTTSTEVLDVQAGVAPTISLVSPSTGTWFNYSEINLTYNASDVNGDLVNASLFINGVYNKSNSSQILNYQHNNFTINLTNGQYNWTVNVTDSLGYSAVASNRTFYVDLENPAVNLIFPPNASNYSASSLNLSFNVTDNMDEDLICDVVLDSSTIHSGVSADNATNVNYSSGSLTTGTHYWNVTCRDESLRRGTSSTYQFNISDLPPAIYLFSPANSYLDDDGNISFYFNVSEDIGVVNCSLIINQTYLFLNQSEVSIDISDLNEIFVSSLSQGNYNWSAECYDTNFNYFRNSSYRNFSVDLYPPHIDLNLPSDSSTIGSSNANFNFTVNDSIDSSLSCNLTINSAVADSFSADNGSLTNRPISGLTDGAKYWNVTCMDNALHSNTSSTRLVTIAEPPAILINTTNLTFFPSGSVTIEYTPFDNTNLSSCTLYLNGAANNSNASAILKSQLNEIEVNGLADGSYDYYINCSDYVPLSSVSSVNRFYVDQQAPVINLSYPNGDVVFATNVTFNFTVTDAVDLSLVCNLSIDNIVEDPNFAAQNNTPISRDIFGVTDGNHTWYVNCTDGANNVGDSLVYNFTRSTAPDVSLIWPSNSQWLNDTSFNLTYYIQDDEGFLISYLLINGSVNRTNSTILVSDQNNTFEISDFSDGVYNWTVIATDIGGINGTDTARIFYLDKTPPQTTLNSPNNSATLATNNVTINYTVSDNLDGSISCQLYVDESPEDLSNVTSGNNKIVYQLIPDGNHTFYVSCLDEAGNQNVSDTRNFTVEAPPTVSLTSPPNNNITSALTLNLTYVPTDPLGIIQCDLYYDGDFNATSSSISPNQNNTFNLSGITEGLHNWTVNCSDADGNWNWSNAWYFTRDISGPNISLDTPLNYSGIYYGNGNINLYWTATDIYDNQLRCDLYVDGVIDTPNKPVTSGIQTYEEVSLAEGWHNWSAICRDRNLNSNSSGTYYFNFTYPDFVANSTSITFNASSPKENDNVSVNITIYNLGGADMTGVKVAIYDGDPDSGGTQIGNNNTITLYKNHLNSTIFYWTADLGTSSIYTVVDPPFSSNGTYTEWNESNNKAHLNLSVGSWHFFYGSVDASSNYSLRDSSDESLEIWSTENFVEGNIIAADYDSIISWSDLFALGKNLSEENTTNDFSDVDSLLGTIGFNDSVANLYSTGGTPNNISDFVLFNKIIRNVPLANSINNSNFLTGILWDSDDDSDGEFSQADREDIVFISSINRNTPGAYGVYDYEIRVPAKLRAYNSTNSFSAAFYAELR